MKGNVVSVGGSQDIHSVFSKATAMIRDSVQKPLCRRVRTGLQQHIFYKNMGSSDHPESNVGSLTNSVHPLLARDKFAKSVNYVKVFLQPARLATRMLATPQAEHYFLALITNSKHVSTYRGTAKDLRHRFWSDKDIGKLEDLDRQCVDTWLRKVADTITYSVRACDNGAMAEIKKIPYDASKTDLGRSIICISRKEHYDPLRGDLPATERLIRQFNLAIALLHELAHAVSYAITARQDEDFFEDAIVAEAGFEFEARLFGACPSYSVNAPKLVRRFPWPSRILLGGEGDVESYDLADLCSRPSKLEDGGPMSKVSVRFMKDLFREQFWERVMEGSTGAAVALLAPEIRRNAPKMKSIRDLLAMADKQKARRKMRRCGKRRRSVRLHGCTCHRLRSRCRCPSPLRAGSK